jgi:hypothetical protein
MFQDDNYGRRLHEARERAGKSIGEMAALLGVSWEGYRDLEMFDEEVTGVLSLQQLITLSKALGIDLVEFFSDGASKRGEGLSLDALAEKIKAYIVAHNLTVAEFEDAVGWEVANCLTEPSQFISFNLDGLMDVTRPLGLDWRAILVDLTS